LITKEQEIEALTVNNPPVPASKIERNPKTEDKLVSDSDDKNADRIKKMEQQGFEERLAKELQSKKKTSITNKVETVKSR